LTGICRNNLSEAVLAIFVCSVAHLRISLDSGHLGSRRSRCWVYSVSSFRTLVPLGIVSPSHPSGVFRVGLLCDTSSVRFACCSAALVPYPVALQQVTRRKKSDKLPVYPPLESTSALVGQTMACGA